MAKNVTLRHTNKNIWGQKVILPNIGETEIGKDGKFEVEETVATVLLTKTDDFRLVKGNGTTVTEEIHADKLDEDNSDYVAPGAEDESENNADEDADDADESNEEETDEESEESEEEDELADKNLSELIAIAEAAEIPEEEYKKFKKNKKLMHNFLKKYLSEQE